jgi:uncharacterized protein (TIGR02646 family)
MIYVRPDETKIPGLWLERAQRLTTELDAIDDPEERSRFINDHADLWREIKDRLLEMSYGKCWYSEALDDVSDWHVDHFRPKSEYHWLAFDWHNFRISGSIPNRRKSSHFPLSNGSHRASWADRDYRNEQCQLLDPTDPNDPTLITFDETGLPRPVEPDSPIISERVQTTTEFLSLDSARLVEARRRRWRECRRRIEDLVRVLPMPREQVDAERRQRIQLVSTEIRNMTLPSEPYSATVRACLQAANMPYLIARPEHARAVSRTPPTCPRPTSSPPRSSRTSKPR